MMTAQYEIIIYSVHRTHTLFYKHNGDKRVFAHLVTLLNCEVGDWNTLMYPINVCYISCYVITAVKISLRTTLSTS